MLLISDKSIAEQRIHKAMNILMAGSRRLFDSNVVSVFTKKINPYPPGSLVKLSTGDIAVVDEVIKGSHLDQSLD